MREHCSISNDEVLINIFTWLVTISPSLLSFITEKMGTINYNPQLVMTEFGYDQSTLQINGETGCSDTLTTETQFVG